MAKAGRIELTEAELMDLRTVVRSTKAERRMVERAKVILCWHEGKTFARTEAETGMTQMTINKWRKRYAERGLEGLADAARSGKPPKFSAAEKARVIQLATRPAEDGYTNLSQRQIARKTGLSQSKVHQLLKQARLKPHKIEYWCGKSTDPEFEPRC